MVAQPALDLDDLLQRLEAPAGRGAGEGWRCSGRRVQCLKYLVLANMLMESKVDPFDSQEARPYKSDPEVGGCSGWVQWVFVDGKAGQWLLPCLGTCAFAPVP